MNLGLCFAKLLVCALGGCDYLIMILELLYLVLVSK